MKFLLRKRQGSSLRGRLRRISTINAAVILLLCWLLMTSTSLYFIKRYENRNLALTATTLSTSLTAATVFEDSYDAHSKIAMLGDKEMFASAQLVTASHTVLVDWVNRREHNGFYEKQLRQWIYASPVTVDIQHAGTRAGSLTLAGTVNGASEFIHYSILILTCGMLCVLVISFMLSEFLHRGILLSMRTITRAIHYVIRTGDFTQRVPPEPINEFQLLSSDLNALLSEMQTLKASLLRDNRSLAEKALTDPLTGLANRSAFVARLAQLLDRPLTPPRFALLFLDGDRFKCINDSWGHAAGDEVLKATAERLAGLISEGDLVARMGGDEFAMVLTSRTTPARLQELRDAIQHAVRQPIALSEDRTISTSVTIGYAWAQSGDSVASLLERADLHMYKNKKLNKDRL
ncbi:MULTISPECIES: diguanylate cyclase domain-containing protein [Pantoea]|uniref:diguanylate cyclase domain-containing protein n=1 Tax=Pantoea TaxID=53335 RepID=UPI00257D0356|nr:diguanylate cyclase [Pantoea sp. UBA5960]